VFGLNFFIVLRLLDRATIQPAQEYRGLHKSSGTQQRSPAVFTKGKKAGRSSEDQAVTTKPFC
jgi:hypothetical protein